MNCVRDVEKIRYAEYMLEGNALHWWEGIVQLNEDIEEPYTWADFRADFLNRYFPHSTLYQMQRDFIQLSQGDRTVEEYEIEFDRLSRYVPKLVPTDTIKINKFEWGLALYIRKGITGPRFEDYNNLVDWARRFQMISSQVAQSGLGARIKNQGNFGARRANTEINQNDKPKCTRCGGAHTDAQCRWNLGDCFRCGEKGHKIAQCLILADEAQTVQGPRITRAPTQPVQTIQS
ncbi:uncharacterized protein LOC143852391 [Tasmannia lanceolata]|uniref:uncharacterized protein LOC143852391 n=1 Tax=Tasmannia lanceolata TaxID=3420 RepID=UPI004063F933